MGFWLLKICDLEIGTKKGEPMKFFLFKKNIISFFTGQEDGADEIKSFPSMQEIGEDLVNILDTLRVKVVIGLGEGIT